MSVWSNLGRIISSYLNDFEGETRERFKPSGDPDFNEAYEELNEFLKEKEGDRQGGGQFKWKDAEPAGYYSTAKKMPPEELKGDFEILGVPFGADDETCKISYKKLLKIHHPDRHAGHEGNYRKATEKSAKINSAWDRIEKWRQENEKGRG